MESWIIQSIILSIVATLILWGVIYAFNLSGIWVFVASIAIIILIFVVMQAMQNSSRTANLR